MRTDILLLLSLSLLCSCAHHETPFSHRVTSTVDGLFNPDMTKIISPNKMKLVNLLLKTKALRSLIIDLENRFDLKPHKPSEEKELQDFDRITKIFCSF